MKDKIKAILKNNKGIVVSALEACKPIGVRWVYMIENNKVGDVVNHKARLVVKGHSDDLDRMCFCPSCVLLACNKI